MVQDGDMIHIDAEANSISMDVTDSELERRRKDWKAPPLKVTSGTLYKYTKLVSDASQGCGKFRPRRAERCHQTTANPVPHSLQSPTPRYLQNVSPRTPAFLHSHEPHIVDP